MNQYPQNSQRPNQNINRSQNQSGGNPAPRRAVQRTAVQRTTGQAQRPAPVQRPVSNPAGTAPRTQGVQNSAVRRPATHQTPPTQQPVVHHTPPVTPPTVRPASAQSHIPAANPQQPHTQTQRPVQRTALQRSKMRRITTTGEPPNARKSKPSAHSKAYLEQSYGRGNGGGSGGAPMLSSVMKAVMYIVFMFIISGFLAYYVIIVGNDVFAFVKSDEQIDVTIPEYATIADISAVLKENDIIKYPSIFRLYAEVRNKADVDFASGTYTVTPSMNYDQLIAKFRASNVTRSTISITIREGWTIDDIIDYLIEMGVGTREGYVDVIQNYNFDYWFVHELTDLPASRTYRLEGYLFPDTYYVYTDASEVSVINKMLYNFNLKFESEWREACDALGYSVDQIITLASMIQAEGKYVTDYGNISSVFHNRLNNPSFETYGFLESDATIQYVLDERKSDLTYEDLESQNEYNTYTHKGLPPGPICNPSLNAISFALAPDETNYYYFVSNKSGTTTYYAESYSEHLENKKLAKGE